MDTDEQIKEREMWIEKYRNNVREEITKARVAICEALSNIDGLMNTVYDIEYSEGSEGDDLKHFLRKASRSLRAANAINFKITN